MRAEFIREHIPERFNPAKAFKTSTTIKPPEAKATFTMRDEPAKPLPQAFKQQTDPPPKAELQTTPSWKQPMPLRFKALDEAIAAKQMQQSKIQTRPNWYIPATDKTRPLQQSIDQAIRQTRATQRPFVQHEPVKQATQSAKSAVKNAWEGAKAGFTKSKPETKARTKMSDSFNAKSGFNQKAQTPDHGPNNSPEAEI